MHPTPPPPETDEPSANDRAQALIEREAWALAEVNRISLRMLQALEHEAMEPAPEHGPDVPTLREEAKPRIAVLSRAMTSLARSIRQTAFLRIKLASDGLQHELKAQAERAARAAARRESLDLRKDEVRVAAAMVIEAQVPRREAAERLLDDLDLGLDRLTDADLEGRSIGEMVASLCQEVGIPFDPTPLRDEEWVLQEMAERPKGSPFANRRIADIVTYGPPEPSPCASDAGRGFPNADFHPPDG